MSPSLELMEKGQLKINNPETADRRHYWKPLGERPMGSEGWRWLQLGRILPSVVVDVGNHNLRSEKMLAGLQGPDQGCGPSRIRSPLEML